MAYMKKKLMANVKKSSCDCVKGPKTASITILKQVPIVYPKPTKQRQLPISRTKTFVFNPIQTFAGTKKVTV